MFPVLAKQKLVLRNGRVLYIRAVAFCLSVQLPLILPHTNQHAHISTDLGTQNIYLCYISPSLLSVQLANTEGNMEENPEPWLGLLKSDVRV